METPDRQSSGFSEIDLGPPAVHEGDGDPGRGDEGSNAAESSSGGAPRLDGPEAGHLNEHLPHLEAVGRLTSTIYKRMQRASADGGQALRAFPEPWELADLWEQALEGGE